MLPILRPNSKSTLLKTVLTSESLNTRNGFKDLLFLNQSFINAARNDLVYRLSMDISDSDAKLWFEDPVSGKNTDKNTLEFEDAGKMFNLINPPHASVNLFADHDTMSEFLDSANFNNCLLCLRAYGGPDCVSVNFLQRVWPNIVELSCDVSLLAHRNVFPPRHLNRLLVFEVFSLDHLSNILKYDTEELFLSVLDGFQIGARSSGMDWEEAFVNNDVRYCRLTLASFDDDQKVLTIVQTVVNTCRNLKKLEIICEKDFDKDGEMSSYAVVAAISTGLNKMKTVKEFLVKNRLPSIIDVNFEMGGSYYIIELDSDWLDELMEDENFVDVECITAVDNRGVATTALSQEKHENEVMTNFNARLMYWAPETQETQEASNEDDMMDV